MIYFLKKHPLLAGSFLLTMAGFLSRIIGFFYRIYLSRMFGEEGMGVYQLLSPIIALSFSITAAGFQTAISKFVAAQAGKKDTTSYHPLLMGLTITIPLSFLLMMILIQGSESIALYYLSESRTASMLRIFALSVPLSAVHACINGYFYGLKKSSVPAACQLIEQCCRVFSVLIITEVGNALDQTPTLNVTVMGLVIGEVFSTIACVIALLHHLHKRPLHETSKQIYGYGALMGMVLPLIANRITLNILQSIETISLPSRLRLFGYDSSTALSVYGVLTGMAFPLLFFPNAITGSFAVLLLPMISEKNSSGDKEGVKKLTVKTIKSCLLLGFSCMSIFFLLGKSIGNLLFHSELAGYFIRALSFICPFLYLNSTLSAILQGMGKVVALFLINVSALLLRLAFLYAFVPSFGMQGYLWGVLAGQLLQSSAYLYTISQSHR